MPKIKTVRAASKRFRFTGSGRIKAQKPGRRHHLHQKAENRKRGLRRTSYFSKVEADKMKTLLPYGSR